MVATAFLLFVLNSSGLPALTALAAFPTEESCKTAATVITAALSAGDEPAKVACFSATSIQDLAKANGLGSE